MCYNVITVKENRKEKEMIRVIDTYGFEWTFTTTEEAIEFIEGFKDQENFEIRG